MGNPADCGPRSQLPVSAKINTAVHAFDGIAARRRTRALDEPLENVSHQDRFRGTGHHAGRALDRGIHRPPLGVLSSRQILVGSNLIGSGARVYCNQHLAMRFWVLVPLVSRAARVAIRTAVLWFWILIETINGVGHPIWTLREGGYTPGVLTAPILLLIALYLALQLRNSPPPVLRAP